MSTSDTLLNTFRADVRAMQGYHVQPAQGLLKMDTMENPYRLPPELQQKLLVTNPMKLYWPEEV